MNNIPIYTVFLLVVCLQMVQTWASDQHDTCVAWFEEYMSQVSEVDSNTAKYFNLRYLSQEMKINGIPNSELATRLVKYISNIDKALSGATLISVNSTCTDNFSRLIFEIYDKFSVGKGKYIIVRLVEGKIINVSVEESGILVDNVEVESLVYKPI